MSGASLGGARVRAYVLPLPLVLASLSLRTRAWVGVCDSCCKDLSQQISGEAGGLSCFNRSAEDSCGDGGQGAGCQNGCGPGKNDLPGLQ
jgi:hypothetical protein